MTTRDEHTSDSPPIWVNLRDETGRIQARYCPASQTLVIRQRRVRTVYELSRFSATLDDGSTDVLESNEQLS